MTSNKEVVEAYFASSGTEYERLLAEDVELIEWGENAPMSGVRTRGRSAYVENRGSRKYETKIKRLTEEGKVVVVEGTARGPKPEGGFWRVEFVDIFEIEGGKIRRLNAFGAMVKDSD
jgi:uncharacterized protein